MGDPSPSVRELVEALGQVARQATLPRFTDVVASRAGVSLERSAYELLVRLEGGEVRVSDLAAGLRLDVSTVSRQIDALEAAGYAHRRRHPTDRRGWLVVMDEAGAQAVQAHRRARVEIFGALLDDVEDGELHTAATVLTRLAARLQSLDAEDPLRADPVTR